MFNQVPVSYFLRHGDNETMRLRHHSVGTYIYMQSRFSIHHAVADLLTFKNYQPDICCYLLAS